MKKHKTSKKNPKKKNTSNTAIYIAITAIAIIILLSQNLQQTEQETILRRQKTRRMERKIHEIIPKRTGKYIY